MIAFERKSMYTVVFSPRGHPDFCILFVLDVFRVGTTL